MTVLAFASVKGSPGVTTAVLALAWVWPQATGRRVLVVDADMAGSGILPGYLHAHPPTGGGLLAVAAARATDLTAALLQGATPLDDSGDRLLVAGVSDPAQARAVDGLWSRLGQACTGLHEDGIDVLVDTGRVGTVHAPTELWAAADVRVLVLASRLAAVAAARPVLAASAANGVAARLLVIGPARPYTISEIRTGLAVEDVNALAWDPAAAAVFCDGAVPGWRFARSPLLRGASALAPHLSAAGTPTPAAVVS